MFFGYVKSYLKKNEKAQKEKKQPKLHSRKIANLEINKLSE